MAETFYSPDKNLQLLIERYALVSEEYTPLSIDVSNAPALDMTESGPRNGKIYGELTSAGLVHVWADSEKSQYANAEVLIINNAYVTTYAHGYNRSSGAYDWADYHGVTYKVPIIRDSDPIQIENIGALWMGRHNEDRDRITTTFNRVARALGAFANLTSRHDALHQTIEHIRPPVPDAMSDLDPYAGQSYGPRVNIQEMMSAGVQFHPSVAEALRIVPEMKSE